MLIKMIGVSALLLLQLGAAETPQQIPVSFYVAPDGNDENSGAESAPFASLEKAQEAVRRINADMSGDIVVYFRDGIYEMAQSVIFDFLDSGRNGHQVVYQNYPGETPVLSGGTAVQNWVHHERGIYKAFVGKEADFRQIYVNNKKAVRARKPNNGVLCKIPTEKEPDGFNLEKGLLASVSDFENTIEVAVKNGWMLQRLRIRGRYDVGGYTRVVINPVEWKALLEGPQANRKYEGREFWLENAYEFIDMPGEWYLDRTDGYLYYYPWPGEDLEDGEVIIPRLEQFVVLAGTFGQPVENLTFSGLEFRYSNWVRPNIYGFVSVYACTLLPAPENNRFDPQYRHNQRKDRIPAAFLARASNHIVITRCVFRNLGGTGLTFDYGGADNLIEGNLFIDLSGGGLEVGNDSNRPQDVRMIPARITIRNNYIENIANDYYSCLGITAFYVDTLLVEHNHVNDVPYSGIGAGWGWAGAVLEENRNFTIRYNRVENYAQKLDDAGGIYTPNPVCGVNTINGNYISGNARSVTDLVIMGIYHDGASSNWVTRDNVIESVHNWWIGGASFTPQVKRNITVDNNYTTVREDRLSVVIARQGEKIAPVDERNLIITNTHVYKAADWPREAKEIIQRSGLQPLWRDLVLPLRDIVPVAMQPAPVAAKHGAEDCYVRGASAGRDPDGTYSAR